MNVKKSIISFAIAIGIGVAGVVPAQATAGEISFRPSQPSFELGGLSPALDIVSADISMPSKVKRFYIKMESGSRDVWAVKDGCTSTPTSTLSDCAITSVKVIDEGVMTDLTSGVQVAQTAGQIEVIFDNELQTVIVGGNQGTRTIEVSLAQGAFTVSPTSTILNITLEFASAPAYVGGPTMGSVQGHESTYFAAVSFNGGDGSVGTMNGIVSTTTSTLPANTFTRSGFDFSGWSCTQGGEVGYVDQAIMTTSIYSCPTLYAVWTAIGSGGGGGSNAGNGNGNQLSETGTGDDLFAVTLFTGGLFLLLGGLAYRRKAMSGASAQD